MEELSKRLISWLKEAVEGARGKGVVFGLSGGIDSAVVGALCKRAFGDDALGIIMPCHSDPQDEADAKRLAASQGIRYKVINLDAAFDELLKAVGDSKNRLAKANIKPRLRMTALYYQAALHNYLVVGSENKSELTIGYFTKHGDNGVDLMPIGGLVKSEIRSLAKHLKVLEEIIEKPPTAGLWTGQTDEAEMGFSYDDLDSYILTGTVSRREIGTKIARMHQTSDHKRRLPPVFNP